METHWLASMLVHPFALGLLAAVVLLSVAILYLRDDVEAPIQLSRLAAGYGGAILMCLGIAVVSSYVPREEALTKWHVLAEDYWTVVLNEFQMQATLLIYAVVLGIAVVGAPVVFAMARRGWGTVPQVLLASIAISLVFLLLVELLGQPSSWRLLRNLPQLLGTHMLLALGFGVGARLPWKRAVKLDASVR